MTPEQSAALRAPFPAVAVGKLPKLTCKKCSEAQGRVCGEHKKQKCLVCGNYISTAHIDLDYVGHAATTDRLLEVDPEWTWRPMAVGPNGEPLVTNGGMWIALTVCGVTRPGFGDGKNPKEIIGDAIRNAAMRFGVALALWSKEELASSENSKAEAKADSNGGEYSDAAAGTPFASDAVPFEAWPGGPSGAGFATDAAQGSESSPSASSPDHEITPAQETKLNVLVGTLRDAGHITTESLWKAMRPEDEGNWPRDIDGGLHWSDLRPLLSKAEASTLIERLSRLEERVAVGDAA